MLTLSIIKSCHFRNIAPTFISQEWDWFCLEIALRRFTLQNQTLCGLCLIQLKRAMLNITMLIEHYKMASMLNDSHWNVRILFGVSASTNLRVVCRWHWRLHCEHNYEFPRSNQCTHRYCWLRLDTNNHPAICHQIPDHWQRNRQTIRLPYRK